MSCEFCNGEDLEYIDWGNDVFASIGEKHMCINICTGDLDIEVEREINFCPMCGEPLTQPVPLTLEQLKQMDGEPLRHWVWIENLTAPDKSAYFRTHFDHTGGRAFCCGYPGEGYGFKYKEYGETWLAYGRKPKGD